MEVTVCYARSPASIYCFACYVQTLRFVNEVRSATYVCSLPCRLVAVLFPQRRMKIMVPAYLVNSTMVKMVRYHLFVLLLELLS